MSEYPIKLIYNGVDTSNFFYIKNKKKANNKILGIANIWSEDKGIFDFIELYKKIDDNYKITLIGKLPSNIKLPKGINHLPRIFNTDELVNIYNNSDIFLNPTHHDTFPFVNIESLCCGTPVVTYNTGGCPEAIDRFSGRVVESNTVDELIEKAIEVLNDEKINSINCVSRGQLFSNEIMIKKYLSLLESE
jgi:glycosyltransferase involved in cell wall biosynthesis